MILMTHILLIISYESLFRLLFLDEGGDTACEEEDDQNHNHLMEKYTCEDDGVDVGGCESIDGPSESFMSFNQTDFSKGSTVLSTLMPMP